MADSPSPTGQSLEPSKWLERYGDYLYGYAVSRLRDGESAEEAVQETFVAALRAKDQYAGRGAERAWLLGILKRKIIDLVRRRARETTRASEESEDVSELIFDQKGNWRDDPRMFGAAPDAGLVRDEFWEAFWDCLSGLPEKQADVFLQREMEEKSGAEICKDAGITSSNLWVLLYRARMRLSQCLKSRWRDRGEQ